MILSPVLAGAQDWSGSAGLITLAARRAAAFDGSVGTGTAAMPGLELAVHRGRFSVSARGFGARFEADSSAIGAGKVTYGDVRLHYGVALLEGDIGWGRRGLSGALGSRSWSLLRVGARSRVPIGASGLTAGLALGWYASVQGSGDFESGSGADAETRVTYDLPDFPAYLAIGYRISRFTSESTDDIRPEELSSAFVGFGFRVGTQPARR